MRPATTCSGLMGLLFVGFSVVSDAAQICIDGGDSDALSDSLADYQDNNEADEIRLRAGTFNAPSGGFAFASIEAHSFTISGGWNFNCSSTRDTGDTLLSGATVNRVLRLVNFNGDITVRRLVIANGRRVGATGAAGLEINAQAGAGKDVTIELSGFFGNADDGVGFDSGSAAVFASTADGIVRLRNNLFLANAGAFASAAVILINGNSQAFISNNTAFGNGGDNATVGGFSLQVGTSAADAVVASNNILWGNSSPDLDIVNGAVLFNNNIESVQGTPSPLSANNLSVDPEFVDMPQNYNLQPLSPMVDAGLNAAPGGLTTVDLNGRTRVRGSAVDIGAYEEFDLLLADGYE